MRYSKRKVERREPLPRQNEIGWEKHVRRKVVQQEEHQPPLGALMLFGVVTALMVGAGLIAVGVIPV